MEQFAQTFKNRRVLVTGHTGFKGSWLATWLHQLGAVVGGYALQAPKQSLFNQIGLRDKLVHHTIGDIRHYPDVQRVFNDFQPEIVFHMAAQPLVRYSYANPIETYATNVMGSLHVLEAAKSCGSVQAFVAITTDKCYENPEDGIPFVETDPMGGHDMYSSSKGAMEIMVSSWWRSFGADCGFSVATARAGNVIGGGDWADNRIIPDMVRACLLGDPLEIRSPNAVRPWQHALEPLWGYMLLAHGMMRGDAVTGAWNFGPDRENEVPVRVLLDAFKNQWGQGADWFVGNSPDLHEANLLKLDCTKAKQQLHWSPKWDLQKTVAATVQWYQAYQSTPESLSMLTCQQITDFTLT